ncbi:MAG: hypothetical protein WDW38_011606 [Sanguina aurantia]
MAFEAKAHPKPLPSTAVTQGFESVAFPKLVRELHHSSELVIKQKALLALIDCLISPLKHTQCVAAGVTPRVVMLLQDADALVRERAAIALEKLALRELGTRDIIQHSGLKQLVNRLHDEELRVREAVYRALIEACRLEIARVRMVELATALPDLMALVLAEGVGIAVQGLMLLNAIVQVRNNGDALTQLIDRAKAVGSLSKLLAQGLPIPLQQQAAKLLAVLTTREEAKVQAVEVAAVPKLLALIDPNNPSELSRSAAAAIASISVCREGKYAIAATPGGLHILTALVSPGSDPNQCAYALEAISNAAEAPEARKVLAALGALDKCTEVYEKAESVSGRVGELLRRSAAEAIRQVGFAHLPHALLVSGAVGR